MPISIDGAAGITFPDTVQQTNAVTNTGGSPAYYAARAWMNYKGTSSGGRFVRAGVNIASVTRASAGEFNIVLSTPMPDSNYAVVVSAGSAANPLPAGLCGTPTTSTFTVCVQNTGGTPTDPEHLCVSVFR